MDATLTQILAGLIEAHREIDRLNLELARLVEEVATFRREQSANGHVAQPAEVTDAAAT
jgi:hypothetical protein